MTYAGDRVILDADSHVMELTDFLNDFIDPDHAPRLRRRGLEALSPRLDDAVAKAEADARTPTWRHVPKSDSWWTRAGLPWGASTPGSAVVCSISSASTRSWSLPPSRPPCSLFHTTCGTTRIRSNFVGMSTSSMRGHPPESGHGELLWR